MVRHTDFHTARMAAIALCLAGIWSIPAFAQETVTIGEEKPPAVEVNLGVLDSLAPGSSTGYTTLNQPAVSPGSGSVLLIEPSDAYAPSLVAPPAETDTFALPTDTPLNPPLPQPAPEQETVLAPEVVETSVMEAVAVEEPVVEEVVVEEVVVEDVVIDEEPATQTITEVETTEAVETSETASMDKTGDDGEDPFQEIETMLSEAEEAPEVVVPEPEATVEETVMATATQTAPDAEPGATLQILFDPGVETLAERDRTELQALAGDLIADEDQRVQLRAYASAQDGTDSMARRLALSRALEVRKFLIDNGVRSTRIDVRALGDSAETGPLDRIDVVLVER